MSVYPSETNGGSPAPTDSTKILGIFQSDLLIYQAIQYGLRDLIENPWLLDYAFAYLRVDPLAKDYVGQIEQAKTWFTTTQINVMMNWKANDTPKFPAITISLAESVEAENTLADKNYDTSEDVENLRPAVAGPFNPKSYNPTTGEMVTPASVDLNSVTPDMVIVTKDGTEYPIQEVDDSIWLEPGTRADFRKCSIKPVSASYSIGIESARFRETYMIGCHVAAQDPVYLSFLHSITKFILLRYREALLEGRGFERSVLSSTDFRKNEAFENEVVYSRFISITGYVTQYWPKVVAPKFTSVGLDTTGEDGPPIKALANTEPELVDDGTGWGVKAVNQT